MDMGVIQNSGCSTIWRPNQRESDSKFISKKKVSARPASQAPTSTDLIHSWLHTTLSSPGSGKGEGERPPLVSLAAQREWHVGPRGMPFPPL
jgi:hypothetical protein